MSESKPIVEINNVSLFYGDLCILDEVNLDVFSKDFLAIIGPNGGGKTTLLKILLGLLKPTSGSVKIFGDSVKNRFQKIGYVPQGSGVERGFPITVLEVVLMGRLPYVRVGQRFGKEDYAKAYESLEKVGMLNFKDRQMGRLSEGQKQRVFIARALTSDPKLLLLDEPTSSVDSSIQTKIYDLLIELKKTMAIILVTHDIGAISPYVDKVACLNRKLFYHGTSSISKEDLEEAYQCPIEMIAHGVPHRHMKDHEHGHGH